MLDDRADVDICDQYDWEVVGNSAVTKEAF